MPDETVSTTPADPPAASTPEPSAPPVAAAADVEVAAASESPAAPSTPESPPAEPPPAETAPPTESEAPADPAPPAAEEPAPATLRASRFAFLREGVTHHTLGHAMALTSEDKEAVAKSREAARIAFESQGASPETVQLLLNLLGELRNIPLPAQPEDWATLSRKVFDVWRTFFAAAKPADQELSAVLHSLSNSIDAANILGGLSLQAERQGWSGNLGTSKFETILDGHQSSELEKLGIKPLDVLPLVNAIGHARGMIAARLEHLQVSAEKVDQEASA